MREHRIAIWIASGVFFAGLVCSVLVYVLGYFENDDWRGFAISAGGGVIASPVALVVTTILLHRSPKEALVAWAISEQVPLIVLYSIEIVALTAFAVAVTGLLQ